MKPYEGVWGATTPKVVGGITNESFEAYQAEKATQQLQDTQRNALLEELEALQAKFELELEAIGDGRQLTTAQRIGALSEIRRCIQFRAILHGLVPPGQVEGA